MVCDIVTENLIKGIIVAYSRTGITIKQIANVFNQCTGEQWPFFDNGEMAPVQYLQQIDGILSIDNEKKEKLWYVRGKTLNGENCGKIYRSTNRPIALSNKSAWQQQPHGSSQLNTCTKYSNGGNIDNNNNNNNNNNFGTSRSTKYNIGNERNNNRNTNTTNGIYAPRYNVQPNSLSKNHGTTANGHQQHGTAIPNCNSPGGSVPKTNTSLYNYDLVGDDFFMEMAKIDLDCECISQKKIHRSGLCISGQNISDATDRIRRYANTKNMKIIVNLGSVDILHDNDLTDMCQNYKELMKVCERRRIQTVITTVAPLANRRHCKNDTEKLRSFNEFLMKEFSGKFHVIDIASCMESKETGKLMYCCYQAEAKYMSGSNQPHTLWNRIGRQRVLKKIKTNLPIR